MFWKILRNYKKVAELINLVKKSYVDKELSKAELKAITAEILELMVAIGVIKE